ncbi:MAG: hypothetical protein UV74_C0013G0047 [Candidatus Woesebacteria bacterium GW2011_GWB1_43_14]|uniref:Uncharacterized protein n=1 Tax=Candidatus Woesebacteria bacterium GW2011_GWB1_43_14 TaxID=1618578 RepID=A0A0G1DG93_9BACT|nr:MAG: hypothetical protein UV51_C0005G0176 [Candidatus Woesebacteria bacterium GW2011_GWC1_42_9]KKS96925.1 MAG: hypothetical protein UV74_C0013G0047 [Candidatus Woesebacteria bacterium GW2011_GWB1_43_14]
MSVCHSCLVTSFLGKALPRRWLAKFSVLCAADLPSCLVVTKDLPRCGFREFLLSLILSSLTSDKISHLRDKIPRMSAERNDRAGWPKVAMNEIDPEWWDIVMKKTSMPLYNHLFDPRLSDEDDFTIRTIVFLLVDDLIVPHEIDNYFEESLHDEQFRQIKNMTFSGDRRQGIEEMKKIVQEYTSCVLG